MEIFEVIGLYTNRMGVGNIIENNIRSTTSSLWNKLPNLEPKAWLDFDLNNYQKPFVNLAVAVGVITLAKTTFTLAKSGLTLAAKASRKIPTAKQLHQKYGHHSWAAVAYEGNQQYCKILAQRGFNIILLVTEKDAEAAKNHVTAMTEAIQVETVVIDWKRDAQNIKYYEDLMVRFKDYDISFLVLPRLQLPKEKVPTHLQIVQPFEHIYMLVRYFGQKLKWRSYMSAIIFPSYEDYESVTPENGITKCLIAGNDAFGRIMNFQLRGNIEVVVARGSAENAFKGLGKDTITH